MRWQCPYCIKEFSKPLSLPKHISEKHAYEEESFPEAARLNWKPPMTSDNPREQDSDNQVNI